PGKTRIPAVGWRQPQRATAIESKSLSLLFSRAVLLLAMMPQNEIVFVDLIHRWCQTDSPVHRLSRSIVSCHVQSNAADLFIGFSDRNDGIMQPSIYSLPSPGRIHIDSFNPPQSGV